MHYISAEEIKNLVSMSNIIEAIEDYYLTDGDKRSIVPERLFINDNDNTALLMPSFYEGFFGAKVIGIAPGNVKINEPTLRGIYILYDRETMEPLVTMDARTITAMRTGAVNGLGIKYLASDKTKTIGIIGTGDQGWSHLQAALSVRPAKKVLLYNRGKDRLNKFLKRAQEEYPDVEFKVSEPGLILEESQIICTTTTSKEPVIPIDSETALTGKHFAASGAFKPDMQELPTYAVKNADYIYVDSHAAFLECGEMIKAKELGHNENTIPDIKSLIQSGEDTKKKEGITVFKSVGLSILDIIAAKLIYEKHQNNVKNTELKGYN